MRTLQAFRNTKLNEPVEWELRHDKRAVFHKIDLVGPINTPDGEMLCVHIRQKVDFADPNTDIAVLVGRVPLLKANNKPDPQPPEIWFYDDRFWTKATDAQGIEYYNQKRYVLYQIDVQNPDGLLASLDHGYDNAGAEE